uniref:Ubiquitin-like protease family profile domain-containing protein n=1 Tax=Riptortus pedestris TaxID=329032 RepID=R4WSK8_RIPPE|nr:conserved hypothetical protein [Riptortus pedestris]
MSVTRKKGKVVLSYHDALITYDDVELLEGPYWLNDTIIGFYLEYLEKEKYADTNVCFIRPEVTQCLKLSEVGELPAFLDPLEFKEKDLVIMPLNDCEDPNLPGGSHWSLLAYSKPEKTFYHIDSSAGSNQQAARALTFKLSQYLDKNSLCEFKTINSLQQSNSYDCGVFVLCNIDNIVPHALRYKTLENVNQIKEFEVSKKRHDIKSLIKALAGF